MTDCREMLTIGSPVGCRREAFRLRRPGAPQATL